jgi:hypothetical protein
MPAQELSIVNKMKSENFQIRLSTIKKPESLSNFTYEEQMPDSCMTRIHNAHGEYKLESLQCQLPLNAQ